MDTFNVICGIITIASFVLALWVWMKTETRMRELISLLAKINGIALLAIAESQQAVDADREHFVRKAERVLGYLSSIRKLTQDYASSYQSQTEAAHLPLVEQEILWTKNMIWEIEMSKDTAEVWLYAGPRASGSRFVPVTAPASSGLEHMSPPWAERFDERA
jgi:hypothetical protein